MLPFSRLHAQRSQRVLFAFLLLFFPREGRPQEPHPVKNHARYTGIASWYGERWRGKRTASGIPFNPNDPVAAHPNLHLPSIVRVTNTSNGRSLYVFVIDRMPKRRGRILDLSSGVAKKLGFTSKGVTPICMEVISYPSIRLVRESLQSPTKITSKGKSQRKSGTKRHVSL
ncbi:MAG: septal ring lytic transglycosylase RlpA family protein [Holosporales bacterium]|jgi:rare lipoprotein A|nr:septal ring lytic transglycosylase RlpA family protein [Holosporales bacterium]